jgi:hypothetical protein
MTIPHCSQGCYKVFPGFLAAYLAALDPLDFRQCLPIPPALGEIENEGDSTVLAFSRKHGADKHGYAAAILANVLLLVGRTNP